MMEFKNLELVKISLWSQCYHQQNESKLDFTKKFADMELTISINETSIAKIVKQSGGEEYMIPLLHEEIAILGLLFQDVKEQLDGK